METADNSLFPIIELVDFLKSVIIQKKLPHSIVLSIKYDGTQWDDNILHDVSMDFITEDLLNNNSLNIFLKYKL